MDSELDERWQQRLQNFNKAFALLERTLSIPAPSEAEKGGIIQFYEVLFELSWKLMKDYFEAQRFIVKSPRDAIKRAFQTELIESGEEWLQALDDRNLTVHAYDEAVADRIVQKIRSVYFPLLQQFHFRMNNAGAL